MPNPYWQAWRVAVVLALLLLPAATTSAQPAVPSPWLPGHLGAVTSWWVREQPDGREPLVTVEGAGGARVACLGPESDPQSCTLLAWGNWGRLAVEGVVVGERLWLPVVGVKQTDGAVLTLAAAAPACPADGELHLLAASPVEGRYCLDEGAQDLVLAPCAEPWRLLPHLELMQGAEVEVWCSEGADRGARLMVIATGRCRVVAWRGDVLERRRCVWLPGVMR